MADSTQGDNPTNAGAASEGDVKTDVLDNLVDTQPSGSEPDSTTPPASTADDTGQPDDDTQQPDSGAVTRLEQRLAQQNQMLAGLGIDPESDIAERFQRGLVSKEELLMQVGARPTAPAQPTLPATEQKMSPMDRHRQLKQRVAKQVQEGKGILENDILEALDVMEDIAAENIEVRQEANMEQTFSKCRNATLDVIGKDELHTKAPDNIKAIEQQVFLSSTDNLLATESKGDPRYITPDNYTFYGEKNLKRFEALRNHWIEHGRSLGSAPPAPKPGADVNPISPTTGSAPITPPETPTTLENFQDRARAYAEQHGQV
jgi:hypothetical protein